MEKIEKKINISDDFNFNFFQIWGTSYNANNKRNLKTPPGVFKDMKRYFRQLRADGSLVGITSANQLSNYK